ncbi:MAG: YihY/virulence factor BrkB family protein [Oscillospiraceae bacterium]|nr:YihY/virulence factor BrkB family protein [Oscillospiraceae bacterium]
MQKRPFATPPRNRFAHGAYIMGRRYLRHQVGMRSAALAFYLLFAIFPMLIFISALVGLLHADIEEELVRLGDFLPNSVVMIIRRYLTFVSANPGPRLVVFGLVFSVYFPARAANALIYSVRKAYRLGPPAAALGQLLKTLLYTVLLTVGIVLTVTLMTVSNQILAWAVENLNLPVFVADLWGMLRFPVIAVIGFFALFALYALAQDGAIHPRDIWPGTLAALLGWLTVSWLYTFYVNNIARYSLLYGSLGTMMVLLIWLNLSAMVLILGAELNGTLISLRKEKLSGERQE